MFYVYWENTRVPAAECTTLKVAKGYVKRFKEKNGKISTAKTLQKIKSKG